MNDMFSPEALSGVNLNLKQAKTGNTIDVKFDTQAGKQIVQNVSTATSGAVLTFCTICLPA